MPFNVSEVEQDFVASGGGYLSQNEHYNDITLHHKIMLMTL